VRFILFRNQVLATKPCRLLPNFGTPRFDLAKKCYLFDFDSRKRRMVVLARTCLPHATA
jgi:hypothetical protein